MDEDGDEDYPRSPFWLQSTTNIRRADRYRRRASSIFFNLGSLVLILLVAATLFLVFVIPSMFRHYTTSTATSQNVKPSLVKRSWDWINLVLVLFALAFGFLSRNRNEDRDYDGYRRTGSMTSSNGAPKSTPSTPHQPWFDFPDQTVGHGGGLRRGRNSSSYPDLRELSAPGGGDPWRFSDDTHLNSYRVWDSDHPYRRRSWKELERQNSVTKDVIHVDNLVNLPTEVPYAPPPRPASPPPPPPPPPMPAVTSSAPPAAKRKTNRTYQSLGHDPPQRSASPPPPPQQQPLVTSSAPPAAKKKTKRAYQSVGHDQETMARKGHSNFEPRKIVAEEPEEQSPPEPQSPPLVMASIQEMEQRSSRSDRKRSGGNATKDFLASLYSKKKKKRQRQRSGDNLDALLHHPQPPPLRYQLPPPSPPPPPPPLPPPPSVFHNLFNKKDKRKKIPPTTPATYSYTAPPPPPPPPPTAARASRATTRKPPVTSQKPPMPARVHNFNNNNIDDGSSGGESPMRRIPPPPPPPPFRVPDLKYVVEGDYARLLSTDSSRSGSPEPEEVESPLSEGGDVTGSPLFCPSPDVDTKADSFIAKVRAGMKLEKLNSFNQKQQGLRMSNLGPNPGGSSN